MSTSRFAICIDNSEYPASLEMHKIYRIIPDEDAEGNGDLRVTDESGEDYLHPGDYFVLVDLPHDIVAALGKSFFKIFIIPTDLLLLLQVAPPLHFSLQLVK